MMTKSHTQTLFLSALRHHRCSVLPCIHIIREKKRLVKHTSAPGEVIYLLRVSVDLTPLRAAAFISAGANKILLLLLAY